MPRLSLESLEARETPAVIATEYLFTATVVDAAPAARHRTLALVDRTPSAAPAHLLYQDVSTPTAAAIVFVGGWGSSMYQY